MHQTVTFRNVSLMKIRNGDDTQSREKWKARRYMTAANGGPLTVSPTSVIW